jgi:cell division protein FtsI (penicillin-binding protein 3)
MVMAAAVVANGGYLMKPLIVRRIEDAEGRLVSETKPIVVRRVLEPETVDTLTEMLKLVVTSGTGHRAAVPGYVVAGKTGTAQKVDPATGRYSTVDHVASFVGFVPATHPALVILAALDSPRGLRNEGGDVAAPLFARVAESALRVLAVPPDEAGRLLRAVAAPPEGFVPAAYHPGRAPPPSPVDSAEPGIMPDLRGRSAREAAIAAARRGLVVQLEGSGPVVAQTPPPGAVIDAGSLCTLTLGRGGRP